MGESQDVCCPLEEIKNVRIEKVGEDSLKVSWNRERGLEYKVSRSGDANSMDSAEVINTTGAYVTFSNVPRHNYISVRAQDHCGKMIDTSIFHVDMQG